MKVQNELKDYILSEFGEEIEQESLNADDDILKLGIVDSMGVLQLVNFIEESYGLQVDDEEITVENFRSIGAIARMIAKKTAERLDEDRK